MINSNVQEISLDGFKVVSGELFKHLPRKSEATCTIWPTSICFSRQSISFLNNCEHIRIQVNAETKKMLIIPVQSKDRDGVRWIKNIKEPAARKIECVKFTQQLYDTWKWDRGMNYRGAGRVVTADNKIMLLFDFEQPEVWSTPKAGEKNG